MNDAIPACEQGPSMDTHRAALNISTNLCGEELIYLLHYTHSEIFFLLSMRYALLLIGKLLFSYSRVIQTVP